jgi:hypothetical protein
VRRVWHQDYETLTVQPAADCPGYVCVSAESEGAKEFWGPVSLTLPKSMALQLAKAIEACAMEQE